MDVGVVEYYETKADGKRGKKQLEVGFVATNCNQQIYRAYHFRASVLTDWCFFMILCQMMLVSQFADYLHSTTGLIQNRHNLSKVLEKIRGGIIEIDNEK